MNISKEQLRDAAGSYGEAAKYEGVAFDRTDKELATPHFWEIKHALGLSNNDSVVTASAADAEKLWVVPNARVIVGVNTQKGAALLPGIVLPDSRPGNVRFGCLYAAEDIRGTSQEDAKANLTSYQQLLLAKIAAEHQPNIGDHDFGHRVNGAEIGHAVIAAAIASPAGIHNTIHNYVDSKRFSAKLSERGITDVQFGGSIRKNLEQVFTAQQIAGIVVVDSHQMPFPVTDAFDVSAGFTLAAQQSRGQSPDIAANLSEMAA